MYTIFLVDDEMLARVGIRSLIDWEFYGYTIIGEADNGQNALSQITRLRPDIIITDAKMPVMNGVELQRLCREQGIVSRFIILSSYSDFSYAREALKYGAVDYLLKLELEPENLLAALKKASDLITCSDRTPADPALSLSQATAGWNHFFLVLWAPQNTSSSSILHLFDQYGTTISGIAQEAALRFGNSVPTEDDDGPLLPLLLSLDSSYLESYCSDFCCMAMLSTDCHISIGCSQSHHKIQDLRQAYAEAATALKYALLHESNFSLYDSIASSLPSETPEQALQACTDTLDNSQSDLFPMRYSYFLAAMAAADSNYRQMINDCYQISNLECRLRKEMEDDENTLMHTQTENAGQIARCQSWIELYFFLLEKQETFAKISIKEENHLWILKGKEYIKEHLTEKFTLQTVSEHIGVSPSYFSRLFKQYSGETFTVYVTRKRIERSKELLRNTNLKVSDIAEALGFENTTYFSKIFKKYTGTSPLSYRFSGEYTQSR